MPSKTLIKWNEERIPALDEIEGAHVGDRLTVVETSTT
jgi:hypothetical protein